MAVAALPVALATGGVPPGLVTYGVSWEFNGPLFEPLWRLLDAAGAAPALARAARPAQGLTGIHQGLNFVYPYLYPQFLAKLLLAAGMAAAVALLAARARSGGGHRPPLRRAAALLGDGLPLVSPLGAPLGGPAPPRRLAGALRR